MEKGYSKVLPVILAGGLGKRLWPISRSNRPKQFLNLIGKYSLFQNTLIRLDNGQNKFIVKIIHFLRYIKRLKIILKEKNL